MRNARLESARIISSQTFVVLTMTNHSVNTSEAEPLLNEEEHRSSSSSSKAVHSSSGTDPRTEPGDAANSKDKTIFRSFANQSGKRGLSLYERKCILISRCIWSQYYETCTNPSMQCRPDQEIDIMGMGCYQWSIWALCGLGYLIDLMWAQAFGLVLSPLQQEMGFGPDQTGKLSTAFSMGLATGAFVWGALVDTIGRKWAFNLTVTVACVFGTSIAVPSTYGSILVLTTLTGFGIGGNIPIDTTIALEFTPQSKRYLLPLLSIFQPLGVVICSIIAYGFIPNYSCKPNFSEKIPLPACSKVQPGELCCTKAENMGWRYLLFTLGGVTLVAFIFRSVIFRFQESPKFLIYRGKDAKAIQVMHNIAQYNRQTCELSLDAFGNLERELSLAPNRKAFLGSGPVQLESTWTDTFRLARDRFQMLFSDFQMTRLTLLVWLTYVCDYSGFTVAGLSTPFMPMLRQI